MKFLNFLLPMILGISILCYYLYKMQTVFSERKSFFVALMTTIGSIFLTVIVLLLSHSSFSFPFLFAGSIFTFLVAKFLAEGSISIQHVTKSAITFFLFFFSNIFQYIPILLFHIKEENVTPLINNYLTAFSDVCIAIIFILMYYDDLKKGFLQCKKNFQAFFDQCFKIWFLGFLGMVISNLLIQIFFPSAVAGNENAVQNMIDVTPLLMLLTAGIIAPIVEELTFRKAIRNIFPNPKLFIPISGLLFGFLHVIFAYQSLFDFLYVIPYASLGIAFSYMYFKTDNILSSMMMHFLHNTSIILFSIFVGMIVL